MQADHVVIGAGPAGLACALRLSLTGKKIVLLDSHTVIGGLNSYYRRRYMKNQQQVTLDLDVGLHAITNYVDSKNRTATMNRLFRSLRLPRSCVDLKPQCFSYIEMENKKILFSNDINLLSSQIEALYPRSFVQWKDFLNHVNNFNEFDPMQTQYSSALEELKKFFSDEGLIHHLLFPVLSYGSPWEMDMDYHLFICLFRSMFLEGFCRPIGGIRSWWKPISEKLKENGVEVLLGEGVNRLVLDENKKLKQVETEKRMIDCSSVFSSAGWVESHQMLSDEYQQNNPEWVSKLGFLELVMVWDQDFSKNEGLPTLAFQANSKVTYYRATNKLLGDDMYIYCFPSRYSQTNECVGIVRMTALTSPEKWFGLDAEQYAHNKQVVQSQMLKIFLEKFSVFNNAKCVFTDLFTPKTINRFTRHIQGNLYGSTYKAKKATTAVPGLYIIGADQGYPGIIGAMLSGVSVANQYGILGGE